MKKNKILFLILCILLVRLSSGSNYSYFTQEELGYVSESQELSQFLDPAMPPPLPPTVSDSLDLEEESDDPNDECTECPKGDGCAECPALPDYGDNEIKSLCYSGSPNFPPPPTSSITVDLISLNNMAIYWSGLSGSIVINSSNLGYNANYPILPPPNTQFTQTDLVCSSLPPIVNNSVFHHSMPVTVTDNYLPLINTTWSNTNPIIRLGNDCINNKSEVLSKRFVVDCENPKIYFKYAVVLENKSGLNPNQQALFGIRLRNSTNQLIGNLIDLDKTTSGDQSFLQAGSSPALTSANNIPDPRKAPGSFVDIDYKDWTCDSIDLSKYISEADTIKVEFYTKDGSTGTSFGYAYIKDICDRCVPNSNSCEDPGTGNIGAGPNNPNVDSFIDLISYYPNTFIRTPGNIKNRTLDPLVSDVCAEGGFESGTQAGIKSKWYGRAGYVNGGCNTDAYFERFKLSGLFTIDTSCGNPINLLSPGIHHQIMPSNQVDPYTQLPVVHSGNFAIRLGNRCRKFGMETISKKFTVTSEKSFLTFWHSSVFNHPGSPGHTPCQLPMFGVRIYNSNNQIVDNIVDLDPIEPGQQSYLLSNNNTVISENVLNNKIRYNNWTCNAIDLSSLVGQTITLEFYTKDCSHDKSTHFAYTYLDDICLKCPNDNSGSFIQEVDTCILGNNNMLSILYTVPRTGQYTGTVQSIDVKIKDMKGVVISSNVYNTVSSNPLNIDLTPLNLNQNKRYAVEVTINFLHGNLITIKKIKQYIGNCCDDRKNWINGK